MSVDIGAIRAREFPWADAGTAYLNHASTGPLPVRTVDAVNAFTTRRGQPWTIPDSELFQTLATARARCARLIGAKPSEIALQTNTSYGINVAARALPFESGDVILTFDREFPANIYPWMALESRGVSLRRIPCRGEIPDEEALMAALDFDRVRCVAVSWVQFSSGYRVDLERIGTACRERDIWFVVDAIQGLGALPLDVRRVPIDIMACGAQKWLLGPWGSGFVYVREELARTLEPSAVGWLAVRSSDDFARLVDYDMTWHDDARRFEVVTMPFQDIAGFIASLDLFEEVGPARIASRVEALADRIISRAESSPDLTLVSPSARAQRAGVLSVRPRDVAAASRRLLDARVIHSVREGAIRLAPHFYNTDAEIDRAMDALAGR